MKVDEMGKVKVLITGVSGFVGGALYESLKEMHQFEVLGVGRTLNSEYVDRVIPNVDENVAWNDLLVGVDVVIHCAAMLQAGGHVKETALDLFRKINVDGTAHLAMQAKLAGVKRFIFLSTSKVNGEVTRNNSCFNEESIPNPIDEYAKSKWEAELVLRSIANSTGLDVVIIRPPLVYGPAVKANFYNLLRVAYSGLPLPFGSIENCRSIIFVKNLVDFIVVCVGSPAAANQLFFAADSRDISISELFRSLRKHMRVPGRLIPVPVFFLRGLAKILGKSEYADRLFENFRVDTTKACRVLNWVPPYTQEQGLNLTAQYFMSTDKNRQC